VAPAAVYITLRRLEQKRLSREIVMGVCALACTDRCCCQDQTITRFGPDTDANET